VILPRGLGLESDPDLQDLVLELVVAVLSGGDGILPGDSAVDEIKCPVPGVVGLVGGGRRLGSSGLLDALKDLGEELCATRKRDTIGMHGLMHRAIPPRWVAVSDIMGNKQQDNNWSERWETKHDSIGGDNTTPHH
jgi:hypothetical protein